MYVFIWLILFGIIMFLIFATYIYILSWFCPRTEEQIETNNVMLAIQSERGIRQRRFTGFFILAAMIAIMITSCVNSVMDITKV